MTYPTDPTDDELINQLLRPTGRLSVARVRSLLHRERARKATCGACGAQAWYASGADRYFHRDGSDNEKCWVAYSRGDVQ